MTKLFTLISFIFFVLGLNAQQICLIDSLTKKKIDSTYLALMKENKVTGMSIAIVDNGQIVYATGYGFSDVEAQTPATSKSIYRIGSITKSFTALSIMQLQQKGKLAVNDELKQHIPEFAIGFQKNQVQPIYLRNIMAHTAGLPSDLMNGFFTENPPSFAWTIEQSSKVKMSYPLAYSHSYSNFGYEILGEIVARKGEMDYEKYLQTNIFSPLGMNASFVYPNEVNNTPKSYLGKTLIDEPLIRDAAAGLIHSNVEDMSNYLMMYLNRGILNEQQILDSLSIIEMEKKQTEDLKLKENSNFGYGLYSNSYYLKKGSDSSIVKIIGHGGDTYTFHADMKYIPELGVGVVLLTNSAGGNAINSGQRLLRLYLKSKSNSTLRLVPSDSIPPIKNEFEKGKYCITNFVFEANDENKLKFKQGPAKIVAKKQAEGYYTMKAYIFGFVPIKIKDQAFYFEKMEGKVFVKALNLSNNSTEYIGYKVDENKISESWKDAKGKYKVVNPIECDECTKMDINFENLTLEVSGKDGMVYLSIGGKGVGISGNFYGLNESEKCVITIGIGRGNAETFLILENGNIFYSGFEFEKTDK
jgi:CubicO group peptidase (beta-lactamase class C family)